LVLELPAAYVGRRQLPASTPRGSRGTTTGILTTLIEGRTRIALEREWRLTAALVLRQLAPGACVRRSDASGGEWYIGPASPDRARLLREAA
jgi:hypothetical protein